MKALIWIGCFFVLIVLQLVCQYSGIHFPKILGFGITWYVAKKLCKKWDETHFKY